MVITFDCVSSLFLFKILQTIKAATKMKEEGQLFFEVLKWVKQLVGNPNKFLRNND